MPLPGRSSSVEHRTDPVFRILTVCSGNLCRSPQAEQLLRKRIPAAFGRTDVPALSVASAGTMAYDGEPMDPPAATEAQRLGIADFHAHRTRRIREPHVQEADLILGLSREHRGASVRLEPRANRRAFTLVEFARIVEALARGDLQVPVAPLGDPGFATFMRGVVSAASTGRGLMPMPETPDELDVEDPYRLEAEVYRRSADAVDHHVGRIASSLVLLAAQR
jgi:protein-tyrosine phosphatase